MKLKREKESGMMNIGCSDLARRNVSQGKNRKLERIRNEGAKKNQKVKEARFFPNLIREGMRGEKG